MRNSGAIRNAKYIFLGVSSIRIVVCLNISTELIVPIVFTYITLLGSNISVDHIYRNSVWSVWSRQRDCQKQGLSMKRDKLKRWLQNKFCASIKREDNRFPVSSLTQVDPTGLTRSVGKIFHSYIFVNHQHCPSLMIWRKKRLVCLRKTARVNFFYPFTRPEKLRRFPFFPSPNLYICFC